MILADLIVRIRIPRYLEKQLRWVKLVNKVLVAQFLFFLPMAILQLWSEARLTVTLF